MPSLRPERRFAQKNFTELRVDEAGYRKGQKVTQHLNPEHRRLVPSRNNLTALSQRYNLYVAAHQDWLYVYEPQYPAQKLSRQPDLVLEPPVSRSGLEGYHDTLRPHSVNHVLVADLGDQEIVVCACDDGDVYAYYTKSFVDAIHRRRQPGHELANTPHELRPFLLINLDMSAWGIAVHKEARLIAVSTNAHVVNVLAFALHDAQGQGEAPGETSSAGLRDTSPTNSSDEYTDVSDDPILHEDNDEWPRFLTYDATGSDSGPLSQRTEDVRIKLEGHAYNIPSTAFCNTKNDRMGRLLASTDIGGIVVIWDVYHAHSLRVVYPSVYGRAGWGLQWIDAGAFRRTHAADVIRPTDIYCTGYVEDRDRTCVPRSVVLQDTYQRYGWSWKSADMPQGDRHRLPTRDNRARQDDLASSLEHQYGEGSESDSDAASDTSADEVVNNLPGSTTWTPAVSQMNRVPFLRTRMGMVVQRPYHVDGRQDYQPHNNSGEERSVAFPQYPWPEWTPSPDEVWIRPFGTGNIPDHVKSQGSHATPSLSHPLMFFSDVTFSLFQTSHFEHLPPAQPVISSYGTLAQDVQNASAVAIERQDRFNMTLQIPELGIVVAGSAKGRVCLMTLHQIWPNPFAADAGGRGKPLFMHKPVDVLPKAKQEARGERPVALLVGVAAGPIFGAHDDVAAQDGPASTGMLSERRWRLMLLYQDETVLSYEVWRDRLADGGCGPAKYRNLDNMPTV